MPNSLFNRRSLKDRRRQLRNNSTPAEATLWNSLKNRKLAGFKFRRQQSIGPFIVDFYCCQKKLAIELDGQVHYEMLADIYDKNRTDFLNQHGVSVIRFENKEVFERLESVLEEIKRNLQT